MSTREKRCASGVGLFVERIEPRVLFASTAVNLHINFQSPATKGTFAGYVADIGSPYGARGGGLTFGWSSTNQTNARRRNSKLSPDLRYDTLNQMQVNGANMKWEIAVPNGTYSVHLVAGDPSYIDSVYKLKVENTTFLSGTPSKIKHWFEATANVTVSDGRLTVSNASGAKNDKICFIDIASTTATNHPPAAPVITEPPTDGFVVSAEDLHMEAPTFSDRDGDTHLATDWEIYTTGAKPVRVWSALNVTHSPEFIHIHFGDGTFEGPQAGKARLEFDTDYQLRVRFEDSRGAWSATSTRSFHTDVQLIPPPNSPDWTVDQPGYKVEQVPLKFPKGEGPLDLPTQIVFVPNPTFHPDEPLAYIVELHGSIRVITGDYTVHTYATNLLNYTPPTQFPGGGEQGVGDLAVDPTSGDLFVTMLYDAHDGTGNTYPKIVRLHSNDGGLTMATSKDILKMPGEAQGQSHFLSNITIGPDGKLWVHSGDGLVPSTAKNLESFRGKILRMNLDGTPCTDNPFYDKSVITARDYIWAYGLRNPFGGVFRANGQHYEIEDGPDHYDRLALVNKGENFQWAGGEINMLAGATYNWVQTAGVVNGAFIESNIFNGSEFPSTELDHLFVTESGPTYSTGPQVKGKKISEFVIDSTGKLVGGPTTLIHYTGTGKATAVGLAAGPDGLYFTDLYADGMTNGVYDPVAPGGKLMRVVYVGTNT